MPLPEPSQLGELLGLHSASSQPSQKVLTHQEEDEIVKIVMSTNAEATEHVAHFWSTFDATYLPSHIATIVAKGGRQLFERPQPLTAAMLPLRSCMQVRDEKDLHPAFARFVREQPDAVDSLYVLIAEFITTFTLDSFQPETSHYAIALGQVYNLELLSRHISRQRAGTKVYPELSPTIRARLLDVSSNLLVVPSVRTKGLPLDLFLRRISTEMMEGMSEGELGEDDIAPWWTCERRRHLDPSAATSKAHACAELAPSTEMDVCGRCKAVRYCCPEHQRADWKRHKPYCVEPKW